MRTHARPLASPSCWRNLARMSLPRRRPPKTGRRRGRPCSLVHTPNTSPALRTAATTKVSGNSASQIRCRIRQFGIARLQMADENGSLPACPYALLIQMCMRSPKQRLCICQKGQWFDQGMPGFPHSELYLYLTDQSSTTVPRLSGN